MKRRISGVVVAVCLLGVFALVYASTIQAGGGNVTAQKPNFESAKISTGGESPNTNVFTFNSSFPIEDVHVTMEDAKGNPLPKSDHNQMTGITVRVNNSVRGTSSPNDTVGKVDINNPIISNCVFTVEIDAKSEQANVRFNLSFSTKAGGVRKLVYVPQFEGGQRVLSAWPVVATTEGVLLPVRNVSAENLTFGRFEICGSGIPSISKVVASGFTEEIAADGRSFNLYGGTVGPNQILEIEIEFVSETTGRGALIGFFDEN